ncbi:MAG: VCBS repeat-containing protein [Chloroherpetonaceae bacterium]
MLAILFSVLLLTVRASSKPLPTYFRYELLKSGALTNLVVGDFNGDGQTDIAGLTPSQRALVVMPAKGKLAFRPPQSFSLPSRMQSLFAVDVGGEKRTSLVMLASSPSRVQLWRLSGKLEKRAELALPNGTERLYLSRQHSPKKHHFFARTETGALTAFSFQAKEGFSKSSPLSLSHRVSEMILPPHSPSHFFTQAVGENVVWFHRPPPSSPFAIRCKESISLAATGDFNNNDLLDLVIVQALANGKTTVEVMFDVGVETGVTPIRFETQLNPTQIFLHDFNGDGLLDIGLCDGISFAIHFAQSTTAFSESMLIAFSDVASGVAVADLNQDGKPELIVSEQKTGKMIAYSTAHYELLGVERLATSGEPEQISVHSARKQLLVGCNRHHWLEQVQIHRQPTRIGSYFVAGKMISLWQDDLEMIWLTTSPVTLSRKPHQSEKIFAHRLFSLGVSQSLLWRRSEGQSAILAILEERSPGAVPQLLFYALNSDSVRSISEILLDAPISADNINSIAGVTLKKIPYLVVLKSDKNAQSVVVYELKVEKSRLFLLEVGQYPLPNSIALQGAKHLCVKVNKNETIDFLVASSKSAVMLLSERLYQPQQISNFPKLSATDIMLWGDVNSDELVDLIVSRQQRAELLFLQGRAEGKFETPKVILGDVIATGIASIVTKQLATLFVANSKLHTVDILRLKK